MWSISQRHAAEGAAKLASEPGEAFGPLGIVGEDLDHPAGVVVLAVAAPPRLAELEPVLVPAPRGEVEELVGPVKVSTPRA
jgi:hypothetical protein